MAAKDFSNEFQLTTINEGKAEYQSKPKSIRPTYHPRTDLQDKTSLNGLQDRSPCKSVLPQNGIALTEALPAGLQTCKAEQVCRPKAMGKIRNNIPTANLSGNGLLRAIQV